MSPPKPVQTEFEREALAHLQTLMAVSSRLTRSSVEAEDLVQDTLLKALRAREHFTPGSNMRAWLLRILTNTFINRYRRGGLERSVLEGPDADPLADGWVGAATMEAMRDPESSALRSILEKEIVLALDELPEEFRLAVVLSDVEELSYREIADIMGCPIGTVMSRLHRGRRLLKKRLYEHARAFGIIGPEEAVGPASAAKKTGSEPVVDFADYKKAPRGARMSSCRHVAAMLDAHIDGELSPDQAVTVESHAADCTTCTARVRLEGSMRTSLRRAVYEASVPSAAFQERLAQSLNAERERLDFASSNVTRRGAMLSWSTIVPLASAAALALFWSASKEPRRPNGPAPTVVAASADINVDQLLDDLVDRHIEPVTPAVVEPTELVRFEPEVGVPVTLPSLQQYGARWEGGRVVPVRNQRAASLRFRLSGHRMTLYVYNSERVPLKSKLEARVVRNEPVYVGWKRGYSIAATDRHGVGYAVASDLNEQENSEIVASLH